MCACACVCVCVCAGRGGGGSPDKVYGVKYGLDIVVLEFIRPLCFFVFCFSLLTITPEERDETKPSGFLFVFSFQTTARKQKLKLRPRPA